jgi:hypothetical protein
MGLTRVEVTLRSLSSSAFYQSQFLWTLVRQNH